MFSLLIGSASVWKVLETKPRMHFAHSLASVLCTALQGAGQEASAELSPRQELVLSLPLVGECGEAV